MKSMKTALATITAGLLLLGGLAWAQMEPGKPGGMMRQHAAAGGSQAEATPDAPQHPMQGMDSGMMGKMMGKMMGSGMMGKMMRADAQDDLSFVQGLLQQREQLGLTSEQVQQLQALVNETRKALIRHRAEMQMAEVDLKTLMQADPVDLTQAETAVKDLEAQRSAMRLARLKAVASAKALLTPEQRQQVATQAAATSQDMLGQDMPGMMGCPMMGKMMGARSET